MLLLLLLLLRGKEKGLFQPQWECWAEIGLICHSNRGSIKSTLKCSSAI
jgi:hypothetical protein